MADTAFPHGANGIEGHIKAPLKSGEQLPQDPQEWQELLAFNQELVSYQQTAEWGMHALQGSFSQLHIPMDSSHGRQHGDILELSIHLHNLQISCVGIGQTQHVYMPAWQGDNNELWLRFEHLLFLDIRRRDCVARFHAIDTYQH